MYKNNLGYIFECKKDSRGAIGIKESFNFSYRDDIQKVSAVFSIDYNGRILCPAYADKSLGLTSIRSLVAAETFQADIKKFVRSNRATYSLYSASYLICSIEAKISKTTGKWIHDSIKINFYVPKGSSPLSKLINEDSQEWGILCDIAAPSGKLNTFHVSEGMLNGFKQIVLNQLQPIVLEDKEAYIGGRVMNYM